MVRAILAGRKTQTRRVLNDGARILDSVGDRLWVRETFCLEDGANLYFPERPTDGRPFYEEDLHGNFPQRVIPHYRATEPEPHIIPADLDCDDDCDDRTRWRSPLYMPRWASRITLEITDVRVERLQDIADDYSLDVFSEGICEICEHSGTLYSADEPLDKCGGHGGIGCYIDAVGLFKEFWDSLNAKRGYGWDTNPTVWVRSFRKEDEK